MRHSSGTLVALGDGALIPIEYVDIGRQVQCEVPAAMPGVGGDAAIESVTGVSRRVYEGAIITLLLERDGVVAMASGTPEHLFWQVDRHAWVPMGDLTLGAELDGLDGEVKVIGREIAFGRVPVFNFTVERAHSYRVSKLGALVHNNYPIPGNPFTGPDAAERAFEWLRKHHGVSPATASDRLHQIKKKAGLGGADDAAIGKNR